MENTMENRLNSADAAINAYRAYTNTANEDDRTTVIDLICNLWHWGVSAGVDMEDVVRAARLHYGEEQQRELRAAEQAKLLALCMASIGAGDAKEVDLVRSALTGSAMPDRVARLLVDHFDTQDIIDGYGLENVRTDEPGIIKQQLAAWLRTPAGVSDLADEAMGRCRPYIFPDL